MKSPTILMTLMGLNVGGAETHVVVLCKNLKDLGYNVIVASNGGFFEKELTDYGIKHFNVKLNSKNPADVIDSFLRLVKIVKNEKVDIIHSHTRISAAICNFVSKVTGVRFMTTVHYNFKSNFMLKNLTAWGKRSIAVSQDLKDYLVNTYGADKDKITIITNGIETDRFKAGIDHSELYEEYGIDESYKKVLLVSRIDNELAEIIINLINTADVLSEKYDKLAIFVVGNGNRIDEVRKLAEEKNKKLGKKVVYITGPVKDIDKMFSFTDIFIGISRAALEAMSCEKPVILAGVWSYIGILSEDILEKSYADNFTGRNFNQPATTEILQNAIIKMFSMSDEERGEIGKLGRRIVLEKYSGRNMAEETAKVYQDLLNDK